MRASDIRGKRPFFWVGWGFLVVCQACSSEASLSGGTSRTSRTTFDAPAEGRSSNPTISETFDLGGRRDASISYEYKDRVFSEDLQLTSIFDQRTKDFQQIKRPRESKLFTQGSLGTVRTTVLRQENLGVLDIQLIIDNSSSMADEQTNLGTKLYPLIKEIEQSDWRINILTTDPIQITKGVCSRGRIARGDANSDDVFKAGVAAGISGDPTEQGFRLAVHGLNCPGSQWVRPNSSIAVLIVSDEDNCSYKGGECRGTPYETPSYLLNHLTNMGRTLKKDARVYGLIKIPKSTNYCGTAQNDGEYYQDAITASGGRSGSICDADYTEFLTAMSKDLVTLLKAEFDLTEIPNAGSLKISVNGVLQAPEAFQLVGKTVRFVEGKIPPRGASIKAEYRVGTSTPVLSQFRLDEAPIAGSLEVLINGKLADPTSYSLDRVTNSVVFKAAPPELAEIKVSYTKNVPLSTVFSVDEGMVGSPMLVTVNNMESKNFKTLPRGTIEFAEAPADGADIVVKYKFKVGPLLQYPLALGGTTVTLVGLYDKTSGAAVDYTHLASKVTLAKPEDVQDGRTLLIRYKNEASSVHLMELASSPVEGSLVVRPSAGECSHTLVGKVVTLDCKAPEGTVVDLSWSYLDSNRSFSLPGVLKPDDGTWNVWINGVETTAFTRQDQTVTLNQVPPLGGMVTVSFTPKRSLAD